MPAHVDPANGYRRYRESQLATARLVAMLRRLDMPLAQVAEVVVTLGRCGAEAVRSTGPVPRWPARRRRMSAAPR